MLLSVGLAFAAGIPLVTIARRIGLPQFASPAAGVLIGPGVLGEAAAGGPCRLGTGAGGSGGPCGGTHSFEGGLTLDRGVLRETPVVITRLLTVGVFVTLLVGTLALVFWPIDHGGKPCWRISGCGDRTDRHWSLAEKSETERKIARHPSLGRGGHLTPLVFLWPCCALKSPCRTNPAD